MNDQSKDFVWTGIFMLLMAAIVMMTVGCTTARIASDVAICVTHPQNCN